MCHMCKSIHLVCAIASENYCGRLMQILLRRVNKKLNGQSCDVGALLHSSETTPAHRNCGMDDFNHESTSNKGVNPTDLYNQ